MSQQHGDRRHGGAPSEAGDGRNIDISLGILEGEASDQQVPGTRSGAEGSAPFGVWGEAPSGDGTRLAEPTYYDRPILKEPVWIWTIPAYFYVGGAAGAAAVLAGAAQAADRHGLRGLITRARWIGAVGGGLATAFLIADLGRPERFLNMLRVFRPTSPLSMGSWILASGAPLMAGSAVLANGSRSVRALGDAAGYGAAITGMPLSAYTSVLLSNTAVPVWQEARRSLPALFVASAIASASDLLDLMHLNPREEMIVHRFGLVGKGAELAATFAVTQDASRVEGVGRPLREGLGGTLVKAATALTAASLALSLWPKKTKARRVAAALLGTAGSIALKVGIVKAGTASARDPRATFRQHRAGHGAKEIEGTAAVTGPRDQRAV